jgi:ionotropic glutamate receptor NMDA 1
MSLSYSLTDAEGIFRAASYLNLTGSGHVWLVTEQLLYAQDVPQGALGLKLLNSDNEEAHIKDSL